MVKNTNYAAPYVARELSEVKLQSGGHNTFVIVTVMLVLFVYQRCSACHSNYHTARLQADESKDWPESSTTVEMDAVHKSC